MDELVFRSFARTAIELQSDNDTPTDYTMVKAAIETKYGLFKESSVRFRQSLQKTGMEPGGMPNQSPTKGRRFMSAASAEAGPAAGAVLGAGISNMYGINPLAGAAAGYGIGALPEIVHGLRHRARV